MTGMPSERVVVGLTPVPTAARVATQRSALRWRIGTTVLSVAALVAVLLVWPPNWPTWLTVVVIAAWVLSSAVWLTISAVGFSRAKRDLRAIGSGEAIVIDSLGIEFLHPSPVRAAWADVTGLRIVGTTAGAGRRVQLEVGGSPAAAIPLSFLDAIPSAIDSAVGAWSLGRVRLDTSGLDRLF